MKGIMGMNQMRSGCCDIAFGVLAGGKSSRMGRDKAQLQLNGKSFLDTVLDAGRGFDERIVSFSGAGDPAQEERFREAGIAVVHDAYAGNGPLEGIRQILLHTQKNACLITATDMPFLSAGFLEYLAARYVGSGNLALSFRGYPEPLCSIYSRECLPVIEKLRQQGCCKPALLFRQMPTEFVALEDTGFSERELSNINCPEEYEKVKQRSVQETSMENERYKTGIPCRRCAGGEWERSAITLSVECALRLWVNGQELPRIICSPGEPEELIVGHLITAGFLQNPKQLLSLELEKSGLPERLTARVQTQHAAQSEAVCQTAIQWDEEMIRKLYDYVIRDAEQNRGGHSMHSCTLMQNGEILCSREDIGRHNVIDRAVGWAVRNGIDLCSTLLFFSGRVSADAVRQAAAAGIRVLCAKALPTAQAVECAEKYGVTLLHCSGRRGILQF